MSKRVAFIGHNLISNMRAVEEKLYSTVENEIKGGCRFFTMGTHGNFDKLALSVCKALRKIYPSIIIEVVITSMAQLKPTKKYKKIYGDGHPYDDVQTIMYNVEETYFKRKITESNRQMLQNCDTLICYVDTNYKYLSGALTAYKFAKKLGINIINIF